MLIQRATVVEGESKVFSLRVLNGSAYKDLTGYALTGRLRTATSSSPATVTGALNSSDPTEALFGLTAAQSTGKGGTIDDLELEAALGGAVHKKLWRVEYLRAWPHTIEVVGATVLGEVPVGAINGTTGSDGNAVFTLAQAPNPGSSLQVLWNGVLAIDGSHYVLVGSTITFQAGFIPLAGDTLACNYQY